MGNRISHNNTKQLKNMNKIYRIKSKEVENLKKVWQIVENDVNYYGSSFGKILFQNHPEYIKYFQSDVIPQFVQEAKIKRKFSSVCAIISTLIVDYFNKPQQRNDVLDFIAMIHKDMQLTLKDLENFSSDFLEMLKWEFPVLMTTEQIVIQTNHFNILIDKMNSLMIVHRENDIKFNSEDNSVFRSLCGWNKNRMIYGKSLEYWEARKIYWCTRVALWSTLVSDYSTLSHSRVTRKNDNNSKTKRKKERSLIKKHPHIFSENTFKYKKKQSNEHVIKKHLKTSQPDSWMENISENSYESNVDYRPTKNLRKGFIKRSEAFTDAVNYLKSTRRNSDHDFFSSSTNGNGKTVKTARERRRQQSDVKFRYDNQI